MEGCSVLPDTRRPALMHWLLPAQERRGQAVNTQENQRMLRVVMAEQAGVTTASSLIIQRKQTLI